MNTTVLCLRADNPSALTGTGTNSYVLPGLVIDPGPDLPAHRAALMAGLAGQRLEAILITHAHLDHSAMVPWLVAQTGAQVLSWGPAQGGTEELDSAHHPDQRLSDGQVITLAGHQITALHTPGHMSGHMCFGFQDVLFSGDHVMGWSTSLVSPPDGSMADYRASLRKVQGGPWRRFWPGHGAAIDDPAARLTELIAHRDQREAQILAALALGAATAPALAARIYTDIPAALLPAASRNVLAHLIELADRNLIARREIARAPGGGDAVWDVI